MSELRPLVYIEGMAQWWNGLPDNDYCLYSEAGTDGTYIKGFFTEEGTVSFPGGWVFA